MTAILEDFAPEVIIVAGGGAVLVLGIMVVVWFLSTREGEGPKPVNPQEAAAAALMPTKASGKKRKPFTPRRRREVHRDTYSTDEEKEDDDEHPRKSILKVPGGEGQEEGGSTSKHAHLHVEFKMDDTPPRDEDHPSRTSPPTPHPSATRKPPMLGFADDDQTQGTTDEATTKKHPPKSQEPKVPVPGDTKPSTGSHQKTGTAQKQAATPGQSSGHKKKSKPKQLTASFGEVKKVLCPVQTKPTLYCS